MEGLKGGECLPTNSKLAIWFRLSGHGGVYTVTKQLPRHGEFAYGHRKKASVAETLADEIKRRTGEESHSQSYSYSIFSSARCRFPRHKLVKLDNTRAC
jgi:hypothetical protein